MPEEGYNERCSPGMRATLKGHRLQNNREFRAVFVRGTSVANRYYVLYVMKRRGTRPTRVGFSVSKKVGNAVVRNRTKRLLREVFRRRIHDVSGVCDLVVIARKDAVSLRNLEDVERQMIPLLRRAKLL